VAAYRGDPCARARGTRGHGSVEDRRALFQKGTDALAPVRQCAEAPDAARVAALAALAVLAALLRGGRALALLGAALGAVALGSLAWNGHGAATEGRVGDLHLASDIAHLLAAAAWLGALAALGLLLASAKRLRTKEDVAAAHRALEGFSVAGTLIVGIIVATGLVNAWLLVGPDQVQELGDTLYGRLLVAKLALFLGMVLLASINRYRLTPALAAAAHDPRAVIGALRRSLAFETAAAVSILALVAWLGTLMPPTAM